MNDNKNQVLNCKWSCATQSTFPAYKNMLHPANVISMQPLINFCISIVCISMV